MNSDRSQFPHGGVLGFVHADRKINVAIDVLLVDVGEHLLQPAVVQADRLVADRPVGLSTPAGSDS